MLRLHSGASSLGGLCKQMSESGNSLFNEAGNGSFRNVTPLIPNVMVPKPRFFDFLVTQCSHNVLTLPILIREYCDGLSSGPVADRTSRGQ